jgi:ketosteroid isomerase-like protein
MTGATLERQIQRLADEAELRNAEAKLAQFSDEADPEVYADCYTEDAVWDGGTEFGVYKGRKEILAGILQRRSTRASGPGTHNRHVIINSAVEVDGDRAVVRSYLLFFVECDTSPRASMGGIYTDRFRRTPTGWKVEFRAISRA